MLHQELQLFEFISISQILLQAPTQYANAFLHTETDDNDLTYFILHQTSVIQRAVEALHKYVAQKATSLQSAEKHLRGIEALNHRQQALLAHALRQPDTRYSIEGHRRSQSVVYQTARTDLLNLVARGLFSVRKSGQVLVFHATSDLEEKLTRLSGNAPAAGANDDQTLPLRLSPGPKSE